MLFVTALQKAPKIQLRVKKKGRERDEKETRTIDSEPSKKTKHT